MARIGRKSEEWGSRLGFLLSAIGSSVGLGNFWRFPYLAGEHGGSAFILIYLGCVLLLCLPLLMAEYAMGRKSGMSAVEGIQSLARAEGKSKYWGIVAWVGTLAAFLILTFYMIISAWLLSFIGQSLTGSFASLDATSARANFAETTQDKVHILGLFALLIAANVLVVSRGVKGGLERSNTILMPLFCLALLGILGFAIANGDSAAAAQFLLSPDFSRVTFATVLAAMGQAFFSVGVGIGVMMTYGAYLAQTTRIPRSSAIVATADTAVAIVACFAIFPIVFAAGLSPGQGHSLFFVTLPLAFGEMSGGAFFGPVFFTLALFAAFASSISLMEVGVSWLEEREGVTRFGASLGLGFVLFMFGAGYVFSSDYIHFVEYVTGSIMLPLGGLLIAIFAGWILSRDMLVSELGDGRLMNVWRFMVRWVVPPLIALIIVLGWWSSAAANGWV